jgi:hypothetical protein
MAVVETGIRFIRGCLRGEHGPLPVSLRIRSSARSAIVIASEIAFSGLWGSVFALGSIDSLYW